MTQDRSSNATLTEQQVEQLLKPINPKRVLKDEGGHSHVSQQDILAHLIRVFGFCSFDIEVLNADCVFEVERPFDVDKHGDVTDPLKRYRLTRYDVCYRALVRTTIRDVYGNRLCRLENGSTATAQNQTRGDAHDLAYKSAISLSIKRSVIALGDQFGLSLYNKGQLAPLVVGTIVDGHNGDVQEDVPQQVSLGNDEVERPMGEDGEVRQPEAQNPNDELRLKTLKAMASTNGFADEFADALGNPTSLKAALAIFKAMSDTEKAALELVAKTGATVA